MSECIGEGCDHSSHKVPLTEKMLRDEVQKIEDSGGGAPKAISKMFTGTDEHDGREIVSDRELIPESTQNGKTWNQAQFKKACAYCGHDMVIAAGQDAKFHGGECRTFGLRK